MTSTISRRTLLLGGLGLVSGCAAAPSVALMPSEGATTPPATGLTLAVMSYNILTGNRTASAFHAGVPESSVKLAARVPVMAEWISAADPDLAGLQENEPMPAPVRRPVSLLAPELPAYRVLHADSSVPLLVRRGRFDVGESGVELISSRYHLRYLSWAWLTEVSTGRRLLLANTHLDPQRNAKRAAARTASVSAIVARLSELNPGWKAPQLLTGDLNIRHTETDPTQAEPLRILERSGLRSASAIAERDLTAIGGAASVNSLGASVDGRWRYGAIRRDGASVDYVWVGPPAEVADWQVVTGPGVRFAEGAAWFADRPVPSDHCPVQASVTFAD